MRRNMALNKEYCNAIYPTELDSRIETSSSDFPLGELGNHGTMGEGFSRPPAPCLSVVNERRSPRSFLGDRRFTYALYVTSAYLDGLRCKATSPYRGNPTLTTPRLAQPQAISVRKVQRSATLRPHFWLLKLLSNVASPQGEAHEFLKTRLYCWSPRSNRLPGRSLQSSDPNLPSGIPFF